MTHASSSFIILLVTQQRQQSFFLRTLSDWNRLPQPIVISRSVAMSKDAARGGSRGGGRPPKIEKNMILWRKIVIFHTKYPNNFRASLCSAHFFLGAPQTWNPGSATGCLCDQMLMESINSLNLFQLHWAKLSLISIFLKAISNL